MKDILLVYNPKAGDASFRFSLDRFIEIFSEKNWEIRVFRCSSLGSAAQYLSETELSETEAIFVAGGTGTINEVVGEMMRRGIHLPLGIIPAGTENEVAKKLGFGKELEENLRALAELNTIKVDVGRAGGRYFVDQCSAGTISSLTYVSSDMKNTFGNLANYMMSVPALGRLKTHKLVIEVGEKRYTGNFSFFTVINTELRQDPTHTTGCYTLVAAKQKSYSGEPKYLYDKRDRTGVIEKGSLRLVGDKFKVSLAEGEEDSMKTMIDGDKGPALPLDFQIYHDAMEFFYNPEGLEKK